MRPYLRVANVFEDRIDISDVKTMHFEPAEFERFRLRDGDVLLNEGQSPELLGRPAVYQGQPSDVAFTNSLIRFQPHQAVDPRWALLVFRHFMHCGRFAMESRITTNIAHLSLGRLRDVEFPVPPMAEQLRIVDILEDNFSRLNVADVHLRRALARSGTLIDSALQDDLTMREAPRVPLTELLAEPLRHGRSVPTAETGFPVLRLTSIREGRIDLAERKTGAWSAADALPYLVQRDDFLVARGSGSLRLVGRGGLVTIEPDQVAYPDTAIRVRPRKDVVDPRFLALAWDSREIRKQIEQVARTTAGIFKINQADMRSILVPRPALDSQVDVVARISAFTENCDRLTTDLVSARARLTALRRALLGAAFAGRLHNQVGTAAS